MTDPRWGDRWSSVVLPERPPQHPDSEARRSQARRKANRRRLVLWGVVGAAGLVVLVVVCAAWVGMNALTARDELQSSADDVVALRAQVQAGETERSEATVRDLQRHAAAARDATTGVQWSVVGALPWVGPNVRAVQTVADVVDDLATHALPALVDAADVIDPTTLAPVDGRIDLEPIADVAPQVVAADTAVTAAEDRLAAIDTSRLLGLVAAPVEELRSQVSGVAETTATASRAVQLLPAMLGADGPRTYLLLVQNNAEPRATGGIPGSVLLLTADDGRVTISDDRAGNGLGGLAEPPLTLTDGETALFGADFGETMLDATLTPDFPRTGELARAIWAQKVGGSVDGVMSVDPGALAAVLGATGPVTLADGRTLSAENAEDLLLHKVYLETDDSQAQDAFFSSAARTVFDALMAGVGGSAKLVDALAVAARDGRLNVWSADAREQQLITGTVLAGELVGHRGESPVVGVYLEDANADKMGYYLQPAITLKQTGCRPDGSQTMDVTLTLTSTAPADAADLPDWLTGRAAKIAPPGEIWTNVLVYSPTGGSIVSHTVSTGSPGLFSQFHDDLAVGARTVKLAPGQSFTLELEMVSGPGQRGVPVVRSTPTVLGPAPVVTGTRCGGSSTS
ncbi:DUF4012 domain-containing protein [Cellulomonas chitinilytica]|uniref:DUF4012 domain-containing protein n=1 Tax=Cellulomonas chitinilytica TaxID=398759 RepID=UPI0019417236|nr:DUF4012 domain-containing protein [Cellulomonas chitinilytica]